MALVIEMSNGAWRLPDYVAIAGSKQQGFMQANRSRGTLMMMT
jgi:hypothetical protein